MKKTNKVFLFVLLLLAGVVTVTWQAIQTDKFGEFVSRHISKEAKQRFGLDIHFQKINFELLPFTTKVINLELEKEDIYLNAGEVSFEFGFRDIFSRDFSIGRISFKDALFYYDADFNRDSEKEFDWKGLFKKYQNQLYTALPFHLRGLKADNTIIDLNGSRLEIINSEASFFKNIITLSFGASIQEGLLSKLGLNNLKGLNVNGASGEVQLTSDYVRCKELRILSENSYAEVSGKLMYTEEIRSATIDAFFDFDKLKRVIPKEKFNHKLLPSGSLRISGAVDGSIKAPEVSLSLEGSNVYSKLYRFENINAEITHSQDKITLEKAKASIGNGYLTVNSPAEIVETKEWQFLYPDIYLDTKSIYTNKLLFFAPQLSRAKAYLDGPVMLGIGRKSLTVKTFEGFRITDFRLLGDSPEKILLKNPEVFLSPSSKIDVSYEGPVSFDSQLNFPGSRIGLVGEITERKIEVALPKGQVDFKSFGPISGLDIEGQGTVKGRIYGPPENVTFDFLLDQKNFKTLGFTLGNAKGRVEFNLESSRLALDNVKGAYKDVTFQIDGGINFKDEKETLDVNISLRKASLKHSKIALKPILSPLEKYFKNVQFSYSADLHLGGGLAVEKMKVDGRLTAENIMFYSEDLEEVKTDFHLSENTIYFTNLKGKKVSGRITGKGKYKLGTSRFNYKATISNMRLKDIFYYRVLNLGLDGDAYAEFYGVGTKEEFSSRSHVRLTNSSVENVRLNDSIFTVYNNKEDLFYSGALIGGEAKVEGYLNLKAEEKKKSNIKINVKTKELRTLAGILGKHNITNRDIRGEIVTNIAADFILGKLDTINMKASLEKLSFSYPGISLKDIGKPISLEVENGRFKNWEYQINGDGFNLTSTGEGELGSKFKLVHDFSLDCSLVELVTENIEKSMGKVNGRHLLIGSVDEVNQFLTVGAKNLSFKIKSLPGLVSNFAFDMSMEDESIIIQKAAGTYGNGKLMAMGRIKLKFPFPQIELSLEVEKSRFPILKKSGVVLSGNLYLKGKKLPYELGGNLAIIKGEVVEEMNDLASSAINNDGYRRFVPVGYLEGNVSFIKTDLSVTSFSPIHIKNGLIDIGLGGNLNIFGSIFTPKFNGLLALDNTENKFLFKGHEFILNEGQIRFTDGARKESPELKFNGVARISDYDVYISLNGPADNMTIDMSSNPPLSQEDILSLLTLGVTSDVSKNLGDRQRQSVTTLSIGSLIMDQLKINQSLNDSLGLRLSIQPEFVEDERNLLEGRVEDRGGGNRFRSSTVLKVQKKVSKKVNLSLSSTVGGSVDQSQEMNVNYKINKSWSLEGVYEVRSNDELEQDIPDSAGADLKFQWSF